jgi:predicted nuclease of predicted toxin-antitoxin system
MRFLVDENTGVAVARWLRGQGHEVFSVYEEARGMDDETIIQKVFVEKWVLITLDKDFGEKIYREKSSHRGVVLLRLENERSFNKIKTLQTFLGSYADQITDNFVVVTESRVRFARM